MNIGFLVVTLMLPLVALPLSLPAEDTGSAERLDLSYGPHERNQLYFWRAAGEGPVLRESTRVTAAAVTNGQTAIDPKLIEPWVGPEVLKHAMIPAAVSVRSMDQVLANYEDYAALYREFSPITHLDANDPPLLLLYGNQDLTVPAANPGHAIHHAMFGVKLKEQADAIGHQTHLDLPGYDCPYPWLGPFMLEHLTPDHR